MKLAARKVLVLNRSWKAVGIVSMERAINLLFATIKGSDLPKAKILDCDTYTQYEWDEWKKLPTAPGEDTLNTPNMSFRVPKVIILTKYDKFPQNRTKFSKKGLWRRDNSECSYCGCRCCKLTVDHIIPKSRGGQATWENCCLACEKCNTKKSNRTPHEAGMSFYNPDYKPIKPRYNFFKSDIMKNPAWVDLVPEGVL